MATTSIREYLTERAFFADLGADRLDYLTDRAQWRQLRRNEILFEHGRPADRFFVLHSGGVVIEIPAIGGPSLVVQTLGPGDVLSWSWLIPPYRWSFRARATEPSEVLEFDGKSIREHCNQDPEFGYVVFKQFANLMSERLDAARQTMMEEWNPPGFA